MKGLNIMKNQATFYKDAGQIIGDYLDDYTMETWALVGIYEHMHGVKIDATTVQDAAKRAERLAQALQAVADQIE